MPSSSSSKKTKAPKGFAQLPEWWLEITPHNTLNIEEDAAQRKIDYEEAKKYAVLAAKADWEQQYGHHLYTISDDGESLIDKETGNVIEVGSGEGSKFTRNDQGEFCGEDGKPLFGRQFKPGEVYGNGGGYDPSKFAAGVGRNSVELKSVGAEYGHKDTNWGKPDWMKVRRKKMYILYLLFAIMSCGITKLSNIYINVELFLLFLLGQTKDNEETCLVRR
jgi:hypothetical protein